MSRNRSRFSRVNLPPPTALGGGFNSPGEYVLTADKITQALGFTPASTTSAAGVSTFNGRSGTVSLTSSDVTTALGYTPASSSTSSVTWNDVTGKPSFATVATTGSWNDLLNKPNLFDGTWASLTGKPTLFSGSYTDLTNKPTLFSGSYLDLTNTPTLFSGAYNDLTGKPTLFDGTWNSLTGKPTTFTPSTHTHVIADVTGLQTALDGKQPTGSYLTSVSWSQVTDKPTTFTPTAHTHVIADVTGLQTALDDKQPLDTDLTAIAALTTTTFGRSLLTAADAADARTLTGAQASNANLTSLAGLVLTGNGGKAVVVNAGGTALELVTAATGSGPVRTVYRLANAHSNSTTTPTTIGSTTADTDWVHTLVANKVYRFNIWANYQTAATGTGGRMNLLGAGGLAGAVQGMMWGGIQQAASASTLEVPIYSFANGAGSFLLTTAVSPINSPHIWGAEFIFACTTGGTLALQWASEVASSAAQLNAGATLHIEELA